MKGRRWEGRWKRGEEQRGSWEEQGEAITQRKTDVECQKRGNGKHETKKGTEERRYWKTEEKKEVEESQQFKGS